MANSNFQIKFWDDEEGEGYVLLRAVEGRIGIAITMAKGGDIEALLDKKTTALLIDELQKIITKIQ